MDGTFILLIVIAVIYFLGKYALAEGQRIEQQKKFNRNINNFDKRKK